MNHIKRKIKNKIFHDKRCQRLCAKRNRYVKANKINNEHRNPRNDSNPKRFVLHAPKELSIFDATNNSLRFFDEVTDKIRQCNLGYTLYFDLSQVEVITPDAVMYLIAIINNTKRLRMLDITCEGNMPINATARSIFQEAGFFKFVYSRYGMGIKESTKYMKIQNGNNADNLLAGSFCDFVHNNCEKTYIDTKRLYPMIVELMTNTNQHAYGGERDSDGHLDMYANWYIFAQDVGSAIRFIFLDTGAGIPRTVSKRLRETFKDLFNAKNDAVYLQSVLEGDYVRSETGLVHRGKGLPGIYEDCQNAYISNLKIISGKAKCVVTDDASIVSESIESAFEGTLFTWDIVK